jgi:16S rRNA (uracil1498-N3)-methyltransferase
MPSYRFFLDSPFQLGHQLQFLEDEYKHIVKVMRLFAGDTLEIVNGKGFLCQAKIVEISKHVVTCQIQTLHKESEHQPRFIIAQSLLKPASLELICEKNTELGVMELWFFPAQHSDKQDISHNQLERLHRHLISALKQSGRLFLPSLRIFSSLEDALSQKNYQFLFGDLSDQAIQFQSALNHHLTPVFFIGPEKGFSAKELKILHQYAKGVSLGHHTLRAETASIAASSLLGIL